MDGIMIEFGKYKGESVDVLIGDLGYAEWLLSEPWVEQKYPRLVEDVRKLYMSARKKQKAESFSSRDNFLISMRLKDEKIDSFDDYPFSLPVIKSMNETFFHPNVTFIVGENGSGKSTLLEALAITQGFNPEGGTINFNFSTRVSHSDLHNYLRVAKSSKRAKHGFFLRAESFYNVATAVDNLGLIKTRGAYGDKSLHEQSHGEAFFSLINNNFGEDGLYILDEPEAALSPQRQMSMLVMMHGLVGQGSQFIISTHSPILLAYPNATIYEIGENGLEELDYEQTDTYSVTKDFLENYAKRLKVLLE